MTEPILSIDGMAVRVRVRQPDGSNTEEWLPMATLQDLMYQMALKAMQDVAPIVVPQLFEAFGQHAPTPPVVPPTPPE